MPTAAAMPTPTYEIQVHTPYHGWINSPEYLGGDDDDIADGKSRGSGRPALARDRSIGDGDRHAGRLAIMPNRRQATSG